jgi:GntR family transcriptional regulator
VIAAGERAKFTQVADDLRRRITSGDLRADMPLPTDQELVEHYGCARGTVRRALLALAQEGLIGQGRGRAVRTRAPLVFHASRSDSLHRAGSRTADTWVADMTEMGRQADQSISVSIERASNVIAGLLGLETGDPVVARRRLRSVDGEPDNINISYYPRALVEGTPVELPCDVTEGVIKLMASMGYVQERYADKVEARMPTPDEAGTLRLSAGVPVLLHTRAGYTADDRPVRVTVTIWPSDRWCLAYDVRA